jgi:hypothetical protein
MTDEQDAGPGTPPGREQGRRWAMGERPILYPLAPHVGAHRPGYYYFVRRLALDDMADVFEQCEGGGVRTVGITRDGVTIEFDELFREASTNDDH